jgi:hypothetical protein
MATTTLELPRQSSRNWLDTIQVSGCILLGVAGALWLFSGDHLTAAGLTLGALLSLDGLLARNE